jgi:hypothetical protein
MLACYHIPKMLRNSFTTISKTKVDQILQLSKINVPVHEFGFEQTNGPYYKVNQNFGRDSYNTKVVAFLEHQNYDIKVGQE